VKDQLVLNRDGETCGDELCGGDEPCPKCNRIKAAGEVRISGLGRVVRPAADQAARRKAMTDAAWRARGGKP